MNKSKAKEILNKSINDLKHRGTNIDTTTIETEVIYNACLAFLKMQNKLTAGVSDTNSLYLKVKESFDYFEGNADAFVHAALELYPQYYGNTEASAAYMGIKVNIGWDGMWDHLRTYFKNKHNIDIDSKSIETKVFHSTYHQRYENDEYVGRFDADRKISVDFVSNKDILLTIEGSLTPKKGYLASQGENKKVYKSLKEDYTFVLEFNDKNEIEGLSLLLKKRRLQIDYK